MSHSLLEEIQWDEEVALEMYVTLSMHGHRLDSPHVHGV